MKIFLLLSLLLLSGCTSMFYQPQHRLFYYPEANGYSKPEEVTITTKDNVKLLGWLFKANNSKGMVIQFHGNGQNMTSHYLQAVWMVNEGYDVLVFDYRGYGESESFPSQKGLYLDGIAALNTAWGLHKGKFIVLGQSLGGAVALRSLEDFKHEVSLLVLDSTFSSYKEVSRQLLIRSWLTWIFSPLTYVLISNEYSGHIEKLTVPTLLIHDNKDPVVSFKCGLDLKSKTKDLVDFWELSEGNHIGAFYSKDSIYRKKLVNLLDNLK